MSPLGRQAAGPARGETTSLLAGPALVGGAGPGLIGSGSGVFSTFMPELLRFRTEQLTTQPAERRPQETRDRSLGFLLWHPIQRLPHLFFVLLAKEGAQRQR